MATALRVSFCSFCGAHLWCQVSRTLPQYFRRYRLFSTVDNRITRTKRSFHSSVERCNSTPDFSNSPIFLSNFRFPWRFVKSGFHCICKQYDVITDLVCIIKKCQSLKRKKIFQKEKHHSSVF